MRPANQLTSRSKQLLPEKGGERIREKGHEIDMLKHPESAEPHETPEVLTWAYHWLSTHAAGGQRLDALCSHREPTVSLLTQGPFRQES
ncbi:hypothetical protein Anapl_10404 [Anas platyrhynchos]|uniref:Uncharacterized protein n=1 Tax=Anas platyrhynchos TaxID=8839 RepID=R0K5G2_ANAPL|nr:hypothetical protein Anapl_10404 [Anas platyrhynchos]